MSRRFGSDSADVKHNISSSVSQRRVYIVSYLHKIAQSANGDDRVDDFTFNTGMQRTRLCSLVRFHSEIPLISLEIIGMKDSFSQSHMSRIPPPLALTTFPVNHLAKSLQIMPTISATSLGCPIRGMLCNGMNSCLNFSIASGGQLITDSVSVNPTVTALAVVPAMKAYYTSQRGQLSRGISLTLSSLPPKASAQVRQSDSPADFPAEYINWFAHGCLDRIDEM
jgi:hypothetical protein